MLDRLALLLGVVVTTLLLGSAYESSWRAEFFYPRFAAMVVLFLVAVLAAYWSGSIYLIRSYSIALGVFSMFALLSAVWSPLHLLTVQRALSFGVMAAAIVGLSLTWSSRHVVRNDLGMLVSVLGISTLVNLLLLVLRVPWASAAGRLHGFLENPNTIGVVATVAIPLAVGLAATAKRPSGRAWWSVLVVSCSVALFASSSRAGLLAVGLGLIAFAIQSRSLILEAWSRRAHGLAAEAEGIGFIVLLVALLVMVLASVVPASHIPLLERLTFSDSGRSSAWVELVHLWQQRPLTGWGFGTTDQLLPIYMRTIKTVFNGASAHNAYVQVLFELGPVGIGIVAGTIALALKNVRRPSGDYFEAAVFGGVVAGVTNQLFESGITSAGSIIAFNFWLLVLASIALHRLSTERAPSRSIRDDARAF
jgi:O-antigen ligase